jgi:hypothetical protein
MMAAMMAAMRVRNTLRCAKCHGTGLGINKQAACGCILDRVRRLAQTSATQDGSGGTGAP